MFQYIGAFETTAVPLVLKFSKRKYFLISYDEEDLLLFAQNRIIFSMVQTLLTYRKLQRIMCNQYYHSYNLNIPASKTPERHMHLMLIQW